MGGGKVPADWDGLSMLQWLDKPDISWRDMAISEYYSHNISSGYVMIRKGKFKYVYHTPPDSSHPAERELYDLEKDPGELKNLAGDPACSSKILEMHDLLLKELKENPDDTEKRCRENFARGYGETIGGDKGKKEKKKDRKGKQGAGKKTENK
jgi:arylsulfatase A-like enzyme